MEPLILRAEIAPNSYNDADHTIQAVWSTGAPVRRNGYVERLSLDPAHVRLDRFRGASVLDTHQRNGLRHVLGTVAECSTDGQEGHATIRLSRRGDVADIVQDIRDGIIRHLSIGYSVARWQDSTENNERVRTAIEWGPNELSFCAVPHDPGARTRSDMETDERVRSLQAEIETLRRQQVPIPAWRQGGPSGDDPGVMRRHMAAARAHMDEGVALPDEARQYDGMGLKMMLRHMLAARGEPGAFSMPDHEVFVRSITTDDFPVLLQSTALLVLLPAYERAQSPLRALCKSVTATDFREQFSVRISEAPLLERVAEDGEIRAGKLTESAEPISVDAYGRIINYTFQAAQNDKTGAFSRLAAAFGESAAATEADAVTGLLTSNSGAGPVMSHGVNLFDAFHGNVGTPAAISPESVSEAILLMRQQKGLDGQSPINVVPRYLVVPAPLEFVARQTVAQIYPATVADTNPLQGTLEVLVEARLSDPARWYVSADPQRLPTLVFASLSGYERPVVESKQGWEILGISTRCYTFFGTGIVDYRGMVVNDGDPG